MYQILIQKLFSEQKIDSFGEGILNDKIRLITRRENVELTPSAIELFESESIKSRRRSANSTEFKEVREYEQSQILEAIRNEKTYCNTLDGVTVTLLPQFDSTRIEFNPNKVYGTAPAELLTFESLKQTFEIVEHRLNESGIKTNLNNSVIKAYHNSFDVRTNKPYTAYKPIFVQSMANKTIPKGRPRFEKDTFYVGNKSNEITAYNKTAEYLYNTGEPLGFDCIRFEYRHNRIEKLYRHSPKSLTADIYHKLRKEDHEAITAQIFSTDFITANTALQLCNFLLDNLYSPAEILKALASVTIKAELSNIGIGLNSALMNYPRGDGRNQRRTRLIKYLESFRQIDEDEILESYYELKNKFKAVA